MSSVCLDYFIVTSVYVAPFLQGGNWRDTWSQFSEQARRLGLKLRDTEPDGNCMFRAFADQVCGDQREHDRYRQGACDFMEDNDEDFAPFIEVFSNPCLIE